MARVPRKRRRLSMTSLIDIIFLLLLFFMLTSTFSMFSEVELTAASGVAAATSDDPPLFLRLAEEDLSLNGETFSLAKLEDALPKDGPRTLLVSMTPEVTAQRLTDLLVVLRGQAGLNVSVLGRS